MKETERYVLAVSACLLGVASRYDGQSKPSPQMVSLLSHFDLLPCCPEWESGLPVPREPMNLVGRGDRMRLVSVYSHQDYTETLQRWSQKQLKLIQMLGISGFVMKSRSPSCGQRVKRYHKNSFEAFTWDGVGLFVLTLKKKWPDLPIIDEEQLLLEERRVAFKKEVALFAERAIIERGCYN
ncbi:DUF523 domain-containing protein [Magnetococcales bacterium HHB-1]